MNSKDNIPVQIVAKLIEKTQDKSLLWEVINPSDSELKNYPDSLIEAVYTTKSGNRNLRLFSRKYPLSIPIKVNPNSLLGISEDYGVSTELHIYNENYLPISKIKDLNILNDLLLVVKSQLADLEGFLADLQSN